MSRRTQTIFSSGIFSVINSKMMKSAVLCWLFLVLCIKNSSQAPDPNLNEASDCVLSDGTKGTCREECLGRAQRSGLPKVCEVKTSKPLICCPDVALGEKSGEHGLYPVLKQICDKRKQRFEERERDQKLFNKRIEEEIEYRKEFEANSISAIIQAVEDDLYKCINESERLRGKIKQLYFEQCKTLHEYPSFLKPQAIYPAVPKEHPHIAALGWNTSTDIISWNCGGSLIHPSFVVTAAHCIFNKGTPPDVVRIGDIDLKDNNDDLYAIDYDILKIFVHEQYKPPKCYNDIALIKIKMRPGFNHKMRPLPACIWTKKDFPSNKLLMMGYGAPAFGRTFLEKLYQGNLTALNNEECNPHYEPSQDLPDGIIDSQICAHDPDGILDTCEGDSGGPLQFNVNDEPHTPHLVGITSFGILCLDGSPGVYTRLHNYLDWIEKIISEN